MRILELALSLVPLISFERGALSITERAARPAAGRLPRPLRSCIARPVLPENWDRLLNIFPLHTVFHTAPWLLAIQSAHGASLRLLRVNDHRGQCIAAWPLFARRVGPLRVLGSPIPGCNTPYLGPLFASSCDREAALRAFLDHPLTRDGSYFACKVLTHEAPDELARFGFAPTDYYDTYCLDLTLGEESLWKNLKSECRTQIRKARRLGVEIHAENDDGFINDFWAMALETFAICSIKPTFSREFLAEIWRRLHPLKRICALSALLDGRRIATLVLPFDRHSMYFWAGASYLRHRGIPAHNLLHWEALRAALSLGLRHYDFVSTAGGGGRFKRTFGPTAVHVATQWDRSSSRLVTALKDLYGRYRMLRQKVR